VRVRNSSRRSGFDFLLESLAARPGFVKSRLFNCALPARLHVVRCRSPVFRSSRSIWFSPPPGPSARGIGYRWLGHLCEFSAGLPRLPFPSCTRSKLRLFVSASRTTGLVLCFSFTAPQFCSRLNFLFVFPASKVLLSCTCLFPAAKSLF
jgi:hypothetical protein